MNTSIGPNQPQNLDPPTDRIRRPRFTAELSILGPPNLTTAVQREIPEEIPVCRFTRISAFRETLSPNIALVILSARLPDTILERLIRETISTSKHARIVLIARDGKTLLNCAVPSDGRFVYPSEQQSLQTELKRLYVQAYYVVTLERYYRTSVQITNLKRKATPEANSRLRNESSSTPSAAINEASHPGSPSVESVDAANERIGVKEMDPRSETEQLRELQTIRNRYSSHLSLFRTYLRREDIDTLLRREERYADLLDSYNRTSDPSTFGLSRACPKCDLDWTKWHGKTRKFGYEQIGANTWRCTNCNDVMGDDDPDNYRVG